MSTVIKIHEKEPVSTSQFTLAKFPFENFTPVQTSLLDVYNQDANCIVASSTGSGKTVCAELFMAHNVRVNKKKTIYLSPLKSLSQEKINEWLDAQHHFFDCNVSICTGDYRITPARSKELQEADIIIMTSEMLNSLSRNYKAEKNAWLEQVGLVCIDECLSPNALIDTDKGLISIGKIIDENLNVKVASFNHQTQKVEYKKILNKIKKYRRKKWLSIYYDEGNISVTLDHLVWCEDKGYIAARLLKIGDIIYVRRINAKRKTSNTRNFVRRRFNATSSSQEICKGKSKSIRETKDFNRVEVQRIEEIGWNPSKNSSQRRIWKNFLPVFDIISKTSCRTLLFNSFKQQKTNKHELAISNNRPSGISSLVHGRWESGKKCNVHAYGRVFQRGSRNTNGLVKNSMEDRMLYISNEKLLENKFFSEWERQISRHYQNGGNTRYVLQNDSNDGENILFNVWNIVRSKQAEIYKRKKSFTLWGQGLLKETKKNEQQNMGMEKSSQSICCDLEIEDNHNFFANGVLVHNCHQIGDEERGSHLESGIMKFSEMNPAKYVMLSATMPNVDEVGKWVNHLNGKPTYLMESTFRQCALNIHYEPYWDEPSSYEETERRKVHLAVQLVKKYPEDKFICFIHGKRIGATLMRFLESAGVRCEYHNANIDKEKRLKIEKDFREDPSLRVVVATSGLSQGLNMPARRVIILGVHRGLSEVKTQEIIQECGRAGRPQYDKEGDAYILLPRRKFEQHKKRLQEPVYIQSQMLNDKVLAFHIVSEIHHRAIKTTNDVYEWYGRTLAHFQKQQLDVERVEQIMKNLIYSGCIRLENGEYSTTPIGTIASMFYYSPFDVADLHKNFNNLFKVGMADSDNWLAMALGNIETHRLAIVNTVEKEELDGFINEVFSDKIERTLCPRSFTMGAMRAGYCYKQLLEGYYSKNLSNMMKQLQMDFGRTTEILSAIDTMGTKWGQTQFFKDLSLRIAYGVPPELVDLTKIKGIGKVKAGKLFNAGFKSPKDLTVEGVTRALKCSKKVAEEIVGDAKKNKPDIIF